MYTAHGHWYPPVLQGETTRARPIVQCGGLALCQQCAAEIGTHTTARMQDLALDNAIKTVPGASAAVFGNVPAVLNSQTPPAPSLPSAGGSSPVQVPIDGIRDWVARFLELKDAAKQIEEKLDEARSMILDSVKSRHTELPAKTDFTIDGRPVLQRQVVTQNRVDTTRLRAERPDLAKEFNVESQQERLNIL